LRKTILYFLLIIIVAIIQPCYSQIEWEQKLDGWVDDVYWPYLFLGGTYYTRISLADIDNDGDLDLFYGGGSSGSLVYFENIGNANNPVFELRFEEFPGLMNMIGNIYGGLVDVDFADLDSDGDLDVAYSSRLDGGGSVVWNDGSPEEASFIPRPPYGPHAGQSNVTLADIDNDGDYDYFSGHGYSGHQMYYAENYGTPEEPYFQHQGDTLHYQGLYFGVPFNFDMGDIDNDGDYDLIVCKHGGNIGYYENQGTPEEANFVLVTDDLFPDRDTTDWMETPELADIDGDGDLDLFLAGGLAHLYFFENLSVGSVPQFIQRYDTTFFYIVNSYMGSAWLGNSVDIDSDGDDDIAPGTVLLLNESIGNEIRLIRYDNMIPSVPGGFADMDADGDYDYLAPSGYSTIIYYENIGDSSWPDWDYGHSLFPSDGRIQYLFTVAAGDLDNDGDNDILVGHQNSPTIDYYRNDGTPEVYDFAYTEGLDLPEWEDWGSFNILLDDIDNDYDLDLLIGDNRTFNDNPVRLFYYCNDGTLEQPAWTYITDDFQNVVNEHRNGSIAPSLADIDKDGDKDLIMTNNSIGLQLFLNPLIQTDIEEHIYGDDELKENSFIQIYPNPSNSMVSFSCNLESDTDLRIELYNILGQSIEVLYSGWRKKGKHIFNWNSTNYSSGLYFVKLLTNNERYYVKFAIIQ